jgi:AcrR family transcriptional regulator
VINPALEEGVPHPATMTPRQRDRRNRLIDAALAMLATDDYERIQVKDVAERAGVSLGTLYNYFYSKERLFAEALVRWADSLPTNIRQRPLRHAGPADQLKEAVHRALRAFERRPQMARLVHVLEMSPDAFAGELMHRMDLATADAYMQALSAVDPAVARKGLNLVNAVFSVQLREWSRGRITMRELHDRLDEAITFLEPLF